MPVKERYDKDRERNREYSRQWRQKNIERAREQDRQRRVRDRLIAYGVTISQLEEMKARQGNCCAICLQPERARRNMDTKVRELALDHDHETGRLRGLLCTKCNRALGYLQDDVGLLHAAIAYLEGSR